jgi:putative galactosyltransferase wbgM
MRIKILHIQVLPKLSGVQKVSLEIFKKLNNEKYDKYILFRDSIGYGDRAECIKEFEATGAKVLFSKLLKREIGISDFPALFELYKLCKREKFDIVHTNSTKPGIIGRIAAFVAGVPLVVHTVHGLSFHKFVKFPIWQFYWACEMIASCFCHKIIIVNKYYLKYFKWFKNKTCTIYNGVDYSKFPTSNINGYVEKHGRVNVLFVGRLDKPKNPLLLLEAARRLRITHPNVHFRLVGDGEYMEQCRRFISDNQLHDYVSLEGWRTNVYNYYQQSDIFAVPSIYEAFGIMFLEAGYYKLPVCSTTAEGIPEVVINNLTGVLCEPNDVDAFTKNLTLLIDNAELRKQMGENGHTRVTECFNSSIMVSEYLKIYKNGIRK